jgi:hypothetical protein
MPFHLNGSFYRTSRYPVAAPEAATGFFRDGVLAEML